MKDVGELDLDGIYGFGADQKSVPYLMPYTGVNA